MDNYSRNYRIQGMLSEALRMPLDSLFHTAPGLRMSVHDEAFAWHHHVDRQQRRWRRELIGPKAPERKRPKRVAKKIAQRGGMLRCDGLIQRMYAAWPVMGLLIGARP